MKFALQIYGQLRTFKECIPNILNFLDSVDEKSVGIQDGKLSRTVSQTKAPLKKDNINKALVEITGDTHKAMSMTEHIIKSRQTVERVNLKRTRNRKQK